MHESRCQYWPQAQFGGLLLEVNKHKERCFITSLLVRLKSNVYVAKDDLELLFFFFSETSSHHVALAGLELTV